MECRFQPALSWSTVSVCCPAGNATLAVTVVQVCQPPVAGTLMFPDRLLPAALAMCSPSVTPFGEGSRKLTVQVPAVATLTVYLNHCPDAAQPRSSPQPVSEQVSRSTPSGR